MRTVNFAGGSSGTFSSYFSTTNWYAQQTENDYPNDSELNNNLEGDSNVLYIDSINPSGISGSYYTRLVKGGTEYKTGQKIVGTSGGTVNVRIYKNGSSTVYFNRRSTDLSGVTNARLYTSAGDLDYTWGSEMCGTYKYCTVPNAPSSITAVESGLFVTISYGTSSDDGGDAIDGYTVQRAVITGGSDGGTDGTVGTWVTHNNSDQLLPATMYRFRVYSTNTAGNSQAASTTNILISTYAKRFNSSNSYQDVTQFRRFDGTQWVPITTFKRFTGSTWTNMTPKT